MFDNIPTITEDVVNILLKERMPEFIDGFLKSPQQASDSVFDAIDSLKQENGYLVNLMASCVEDTLDAYKSTTGGVDEVEFETLRVLLYKELLNLLDAIDCELWAEKMARSFD